MDGTNYCFKITETTIKGRKCRFLVLDIDGIGITLGYLDNFNNLHFKKEVK